MNLNLKSRPEISERGDELFNEARLYYSKNLNNVRGDGFMGALRLLNLIMAAI